ncbi:MAG TPA: HlyD family type I secretion periplasmic adaptor subunit, partial [Caulobacteraceae bacterium]|nr:HlyD family type I secretion periplasmic adaptor subunit [Caulobacteraceae bacterium]
GMPYYLARVSVPEPELAKLDGKRMVPGMAADLMLTVGERSALHYLLSPLTDVIGKAMRES